MKELVFKGCGTAISTPFTESGVNFKEFGKLLEFQIENKVDAIIVCGTTGESSTMTTEEKKETIKYAIDKINKKKILNNLMLLEDNSTKIIITHDIGLAPHFKKIIFINNGQAICGTHEELLKNKNYRKVYDLNLNKLGEEYA